MNISGFPRNRPMSSGINKTSLPMVLSWLVKFWWLIEWKFLLQQNFTFALSLPHLLILILNLYSFTGIYTRWVNSVSFLYLVTSFYEVIGVSLQLLTPFRFDWKWQKGEENQRGQKLSSWPNTVFFLENIFLFPLQSMFPRLLY